jgi:hypothetical protein
MLRSLLLADASHSGARALQLYGLPTPHRALSEVERFLWRQDAEAIERIPDRIRSLEKSAVPSLAVSGDEPVDAIRDGEGPWVLPLFIASRAGSATAAKLLTTATQSSARRLARLP